MNIGNQISTIRKEQQLTQEQFGALFHVTRQTVSNWEKWKEAEQWEMTMKRSRTMGDETQCPVFKSRVLYFKMRFLRSLKLQNPVFSETIILHLSEPPDLLRRYGLLQHAVRHIQRSCHRRCDRCTAPSWQLPPQRPRWCGRRWLPPWSWAAG